MSEKLTTELPTRYFEDLMEAMAKEPKVSDFKKQPGERNMYEQHPILKGDKIVRQTKSIRI